MRRCARNGLTLRAAVEKEGFRRGTTDYRGLLSDPEEGSGPCSGRASISSTSSGSSLGVKSAP